MGHALLTRLRLTFHRLVGAPVIGFGLAAFLVCDLSPPGWGAEAAVAGTAQFLMISDIHFDPMADPKLVDRLAAADPEKWQAILENSDANGVSRYGKDSNWPLLRSALGQMKETLPAPAFVLLPGDFLAHNFRGEFDAAAADHSDASYRLFVQRTMRFLGMQLADTFPDTPILPALGNNDEVCGDYRLQPEGPFLADMLPILRALAGNLATPGLDRNWMSHGNYSVVVRGLRIVFPNTVFFSLHYQNACGTAAIPDPAEATLAWLETELAAAKQAQERVWLVYHIPPGVDGYATLQHGSCPGAIVPMWNQGYAAPFDALLRRYADTLAASFAGHTHMDDFRLLGAENGYYAFTLVTPALSPIFGQNPAFRTVVYDPAGALLDQTTYNIANLQAASVGGGVPPLWQAEYTFTEAWRLPRVDLAGLARLYRMTADVPEDRDRWHTLYAVSSPGYWSADPAGSERAVRAVRAYHCAAGNVGLSGYGQCYCGGGK
jgi:sphingomyelin phosphodiesterase acid-like 3